MKKLFTAILLLLSITAWGQSWQQTGNTLQRRIVGSDTNYRFSLGSPGFMYFYTQPQVNSLFPVGLQGQQLKVQTENTNHYTPVEPLMYAEFIYSDDQLTRALANGSSTQQKIFNTWKRYSHGGDPNPANPQGNGINNNLPGQPSQVASWNYNTGTNTINSTFNSGSIIGFISGADAKFDTYIHSVTLGSTENDNDQIGVVLAFVEDPNDLQTNRAFGMSLPGVDTANALIPNQHSLTLIRNRNGAPNSYFIVYDYNKLTQLIVADGSALGGLFSTSASWLGNTVDVRIQRAGDVFTVTTSQFSDAPGGKGSLAFPVVLNLNSNPVLTKFKNSQPYGYAAKSQANATFTNVSFSGSNNVIYDLRNGAAYTFTGSGYTLDTDKNLYADFGSRFFWRNTTEGSYGYIQPGNINDIIIPSQFEGIPIKSPDGTAYRIIVSNGGTLSTTIP